MSNRSRGLPVRGAASEGSDSDNEQGDSSNTAGVVKRRKREAVGGAQFVDIPNRPVSFTATQVHNPLAGAMAGRGGYDEIPSAGPKANSAVDAYGNTDL